MATLRLVYALTFMAQVLVAALMAATVRALAGGAPRPSEILAWVLVALALLQLPFAALMSARLGTISSRQVALARTLFTAIILSATAWSTALALATGQRGLSVYVLLSLVMLSYALGFLAVTRLAGRGAELPPRGGPKGGAGSGDGSGGGVSAGNGGGPGASSFEAGVPEDVDHVKSLGGA